MMATASNTFSLTGIPAPMPAELHGHRWKKKFEIYLKATRQTGDSTSDKAKTSLLLHAIGRDSLEAYRTFAFDEGEGEKYTIVLQKLDEFHLLKAKANVTCERHTFSTRSQEVGESIDL